jgi:hypothetical protein
MLTFESSTAAFSALPCPRLAQNGRNVTPRQLDFISAESSAQFTEQARLVPDWGTQFMTGRAQLSLFSPDPTLILGKRRPSTSAPNWGFALFL